MHDHGIEINLHHHVSLTEAKKLFKTLQQKSLFRKRIIKLIKNNYHFHIEFYLFQHIKVQTSKSLQFQH